MLSTKLFREKALKKTSTSDSLDLTVKIISPQAWLVLLGIGVIIFFFIIWGYFGYISDIVTGQGIIMKGTGNFEILSNANGVITDIKIDAGDSVKKGDIVARVAQPQIIDQIKAETSMLNLLKKKRELSILVSKKEGISQLKALNLNDGALKNIILNYKKEAAFLKAIIIRQKVLLQKGLITKEDFFTSKTNYYQALENISNAQNQINQNYAAKINLQKQKTEDILGYDEEIRQTSNKLNALQKQFEQTSYIYSQVSGKILDLNINEGSVVSIGQSIATVEKADQFDVGDQAIIYISAGDGKRVLPGMTIQISPSTAKVEQWGSIVGVVTSVSLFPVSSTELMRVLHNELLVNQLTANSTPIELRVKLIPSLKTYSGYKWTSSTGPHLKIYSGTLCSATAIVDKQRPINKVIPFFRKAFGPYYDLAPPK